MRPLILLVWFVVGGCRNTAEPATATDAAAEAATPKTIRVKDHGFAFLDAENTPGVLLDTNAAPPPPPPPGFEPAVHPFLTASCYGGRPELCSQARELLLASRSWVDFIARLRSAGFAVEPR